MSVSGIARLNEFVKRVHYPKGKMEWRTPVNGPGFFPVCNGFLCDRADAAAVVTLILGQDFGTDDYYQNVLQSNAGNPGSGDLGLRSATIINLGKLISETGLNREGVFCTNAYPGIRVSGKMTGPCPGRNDQDYLNDSISLLADTLRAFPAAKTIFILGLETASFLKKAFPDDAVNWKSASRLRDYCTLENLETKVEFEGRFLRVFFLLHPSFSAVNRARLRYDEVALLNKKMRRR